MRQSLNGAWDSVQMLKLSQKGQHTKEHLCQMGTEEQGRRPKKRRHSLTNRHALSFISFGEPYRCSEQINRAKGCYTDPPSLPTCTPLQLPLPKIQIPGFNQAVGQRGGHQFISCLVTTCISGHLLTDPLTDGKLGGHWERGQKRASLHGFGFCRGSSCSQV